MLEPSTHQLCTMNGSGDVSADNEENTIKANCCGNYLSLQPSKCGVRLLRAQTLSDLPLYQMCWRLLEEIGAGFLADLHDMNIFCLDELFSLSMLRNILFQLKESLVSVFIYLVCVGSWVLLKSVPQLALKTFLVLISSLFSSKA